MKARILLAAATLGVASLGLAIPAFADTPAKTADSTANCFRSADWRGWRSPDSKTIYFRVNLHDIWKIDLSGGSNLLTDPTNHLVNVLRGSNFICRPIDLNDLKVSDGRITEPLFVKAITKLTPEQAAAIPKKDLP